MKRKISILIILISILLSSTNIYGEESFLYVTINCLDLDNNELNKTVLEYQENEKVTININDYAIENYEIDSFEYTDSFIQNDNLLTIDEIVANEEITIKYAKISKYTVNHYVEDENGITLIETTEKEGRVNDLVPKEDDYVIPEGHRVIGKDEANVQEDGSAIVNIYYSLELYRVSFDLNGGINGPEDIYQKYGYKIENLKSPTKDSYEFIGWFKDPECLIQEDVENMYVREDLTYYAGYKLKEETAPVTIVYYGENANDERYSYLFDKTIELPLGGTYSFDPNTEDEYIHKHKLSCYGVSNLTPVTLSDYELKGFKLLSENLEDNYVYVYRDRGIINFYKIYVKLDGEFYETDSNHISHQIGETVELKEKLTDATDYFMLFMPAKSCDSMYEFDHANTITVKESDNVVAIYLKRTVYTLCFGNNEYFPNDHYGHIEAKWGQQIYDEYNKISTFSSDDYGWNKVNGDSGTLKVLISMPRENNNYYRVYKLSGSKSINYYIYKDDDYKKIYSTNWPLSASQITQSDFIEIDGYKVNEELSVKVGDHLDWREENNIYYDPKEYELLLVSYPGVTKSYMVKFAQPMVEASEYIPTPRSEYESFGGWYLNTKFEGEPLDLSTKLMPAYSLSIHAKWNIKEFNVRFIDSKNSLDQTVKVKYGESILEYPVIDDPDFIGWIKDDLNNEIINIDNFKVTEDINLYARYNDDEFINFTINYLDKDNNPVSPPTKGSIISGNKIYVTPKPSSNLFINYKDEYISEEKQYSFLVDVNNYEFNIYYVPINKYLISFNPINLKDGDSLLVTINGKSFNNLEVPINGFTTITGFYENETYEINIDNTYSYTYENINPISITVTKDETIDLNLNKVIEDYFNKEEHILNVFN